MSCIGRRPLSERGLVGGRGEARGQLPGRDGAESRVVTLMKGVTLRRGVILSRVVTLIGTFTHSGCVTLS